MDLPRTQSRSFSIRQKLTLLILAVVAVALLVVGIALLAGELMRARIELVADLETQIDVIAPTLAPAVGFNDPQTAGEILRGLNARANILQAAFYRLDGRLFARYERPGAKAPALPAAPGAPGHRFEDGLLVMVQSVRFLNDTEGTILLRADFSDQRARLMDYAWILAGSSLGALLVALTLGTRLQRMISAPILDLRRAAGTVMRKQDYSLRARKHQNDEIGSLADGFNEMLAQIQARGEALRASEERLSHALRGASDGLWDWNLADDRVYFSPRWKEMLGYAEDEIEGHLSAWERLVHPDDVAGTLQRVADCREGRAARLEVEFRMRHKDGHWRDILSRAILIRDAQNRPTRFVGTHVDITERKRLERELLEVSDREQARIGQDIHDGLCQHLVSTGFALSLLERQLHERGAVDDAARLRELGRMLDGATAQAYDLVGGLFPARLAEEGLANALQEFCHQLSLRHEIRFTVDYPDPVRVNETEATHLFRIAQEAINNAVKHAKARRITVSLREEAGRITLAVADDGIGMPPHGRETGGFGLHFIRYRAAALGAVLELAPAPGGGTVLTCSLHRTA